ncbi:MAG: PQQ-dependent sugar dehydrogenase [Pyrinomonadaceae bacterium]
MKNIVRSILLLVVTLWAASAFAQGVPAPYTPRLQTFLTGLSRPVLIRSSPDATKRLFIVQQGGLIRVLQPGSTSPTTFLDLTGKIVIPVSGGDERGLLGMTFHPQFATNGKFYVNYTRVGDGATVIAEYAASLANPNQGDPATERILLTIPQPFTNHNGGNVEFGPDGYLYIGMGDGGSANDPGNRAQNRSLLLGKMLRIDVNIPQGSQVPYLIPPTNPFVGAGTSRCDGGSTTAGVTCQEIWTIGMRNPWRWSFDRQNGDLWIADVGQNALEEVNVVTSGGGNYGWRVYEGTQCTNIDPTLCTNPPTTYIPPLFQYSHSSGRCSVTGGFVYRGTQGSLPAGSYVYADYCTGEIFLWNGTSSSLLIDTPRNIVSFGQDNNGEIYVCYSNGQIDRITRARSSADFDGDLKTDLSIFRPGSGLWYVNHSSNSTNRIQGYGLSDDIPVPEDYDGDNITDVAVFRPSTGVWYIFKSSTNTTTIAVAGASGDIPVAADYDGDAKADIAVYRPSNQVWTIHFSSSSAVGNFGFGSSGDIPTPGDYDGDGLADRAIFRPLTGQWWWSPSGSPATAGFRSVSWGQNGDIPAAGDFDGDQKMDPAVYRPSTGVWYILQSSNGAAQYIQWGISEDIPVVGDYDGDGRDDVSVFRPSTGVWYVLRSSNGSFFAAQWGLGTDLPVPKYDAP